MDDRQTPTPIVWPAAWLMTDARLGEMLWTILARMPTESGVVLRDLAIGEAVARICSERGLILAVSRDVAAATRLGAALVHNPASATALPFSRSVHDEAEARQAKADGAALVFVSPVYPTRSHPGGPTLGENEAARIATISGVTAIALGGMDQAKFDTLCARNFHGWAGIDAWLSPATP